MTMYEELVGALRKRAMDLPEKFSRNAVNIDLLMKAADAIEKLEKAVPRWISVTERLPKDEKFVLVCNDDGHMLIAKHETETYEWYYKYTNYDFDIWDNEEQGPVCY